MILSANLWMNLIFMLIRKIYSVESYLLYDD